MQLPQLSFLQCRWSLLIHYVLIVHCILQCERTYVLKIASVCKEVCELRHRNSVVVVHASSTTWQQKCLFILRKDDADSLFNLS